MVIFAIDGHGLEQFQCDGPLFMEFIVIAKDIQLTLFFDANGTIH